MREDLVINFIGIPDSGFIDGKRSIFRKNLSEAVRKNLQRTT